MYQSRLLITGPVVTLTNEPDAIQTERTITLTGVAENITHITLNDRAIVTTQDGRFIETVVLENGYSTVEIAANDRYGRETQVSRTFIYTPVGSTSEQSFTSW